MQLDWLEEFRRSLRIAWTLAVKTLENRYARSGLGLLWLLLTPIAMVLVYWAVFGLVLGIEWPQAPGGQKLGYIVPFMAGLAIYLYLSDVVTASLNVFVQRRSYVRKSPLPLWVLWMAAFMGSTVVAAVNLAILLTLALAYGLMTPTGVINSIPVIIIVMVLLASVSMLLALVGPFAGDLSSGIPVVLRVLFYTAPITYPLSIIPPSARPWLWVNPLTPLVEMLRDTLVLGNSLPWITFSVMATVALLLGLLAQWTYMRVAEAVRDVV